VNSKYEKKQRFPYFDFVIILFSILVFTNSYSQYVFSTALLAEKRLYIYTRVANVGQRDLDIEYVMANFESLKPRTLKQRMTIWALQNNFCKSGASNPTDLGLHYYLETVRPVTDLVELYTIDESSGRLVKVISGDNLPFKRTYDNHKNTF
jgi:hypothetical protein